MRFVERMVEQSRAPGPVTSVGVEKEQMGRFEGTCHVGGLPRACDEGRQARKSAVCSVNKVTISSTSGSQRLLSTLSRYEPTDAVSIAS